MSDPFVALNGTLIPTDTASVPISDRGLLYGDGLFETIRIYSGVPFRLHSHLNRLSKAAETLRFRTTLTEQAFEATISELLSANVRSDGVLRVMVTRGSGEPGLDPNEALVPTVLMTTSPARATLAPGCHVVTVQARRDERSPLSLLKSINYLPNILARFEVKDRNADEGLSLNVAGAVAEGTVSNVFWMKGSVLYTPAISCGILAGVTRQIVLEIAEKEGILVAEGSFGLSALRGAEALLLTNSLIELVSASRLDDLCFENRDHPIITKLQDAYREIVGRETTSS
jgi:aminodeoxychorismate lyase